jgi:hypothetical protein
MKVLSKRCTGPVRPESSLQINLIERLIIREYKMESLPKQEIKYFDSEKLPYRVLISPDAHKYFPRITDDEMKTHVEKFCFIIGQYKVQNGVVEINVDGTYEPNSVEVEVTEASSQIRLDAVEAYETFRIMKKEGGLEEDVFIVGDVHTHPVESGKPWLPSQTDKENMIEGHQMNIHGSHPYFSGIIFRRDGGNMAIAFYRVVKDEKDNYKVIPLSDYEFTK